MGAEDWSALEERSARCPGVFHGIALGRDRRLGAKHRGVEGPGVVSRGPQRSDCRPQGGGVRPIAIVLALIPRGPTKPRTRHRVLIRPTSRGVDRGLAAIGLAPRRWLPVCALSLAQCWARLRLSPGRGSSIPASVRPTALDRTSGDCPAVPGLMLPARCRANDRCPGRCPLSSGRLWLSPVRPAALAGLWSAPCCACYRRIPARGTAL